MSYEALFKWRGKPATKGKVVEIKDIYKLSVAEMADVVKCAHAFDELQGQLDGKEPTYMSEDEVKQWLDEIIREDTDKLWGLKENNRILGLVTTHKYVNKRRRVKYMYIGNLMVSKEAEGLGVATVLIEHVKSISKGFTISLSVNNDNTRAKELYERIGFKPKYIDMEIQN